MRRRAFVLGSLSLASSAVWTPSAWAQRPDPLDGREPDDPSALTLEERRHVPVLVLPEVVRAGRPFDLVVQVGLDPHAMSSAHHVEWIEVHLDRRRVLAAQLGPGIAFPVLRASVVLDAPATLTARARCNLHETWRTQRRIEVR